MSDKNQRPERDKSDKSIIDHVADKLVEPEETVDEPMVHKPMTRAGKPPFDLSQTVCDRQPDQFGGCADAQFLAHDR